MRADEPVGLTATYSAVVNIAGATGQGIVIDTYPGRWISVQVTGLGTGSAAATFGFSMSNSPSVGFTGSFLQSHAISATANAVYQTALSADGILHGPIKARYVKWISVASATAGPTSNPITAFATVWDEPGQTIG